MRMVVVGVVALALAGCAARSPQDLRTGGTAQTYAFAAPVAAVKSCLAPALDDAQLFPVEPWEKRPAQVRERQDGVEIFAMDQALVIYVIDLVADGRRTTATAFVKNGYRSNQIAAVMKRCGALG